MIDTLKVKEAGLVGPLTYNQGMAPTYWKHSWSQLPYGIDTLPKSDDNRYLPERWVAVERRIWQKFIEGLPALSKQKILDLGCGAGKLIKFFLENGVDMKNITAVDENPQLIKWCSNMWTHSKFICTDATNILHHKKLVDQKFNLVTAHMLVNLLDDKQFSKVLSGVYERLHEGGILAIQIPSIQGKINSYPNLAQTQDNSQLLYENTPWGKTPYYHRPQSLINKFVTQSGFTLERVSDYSYGSFDQNTVHFTSLLDFPRNEPKRLFLICKK